MGQRRKYTNEFKLDAVKLVESSSTSMAQVARNLGIGETVLHRWVRQFGQRADGTRFTPEQQEELVRLRRENTQLRMERDIRKKPWVSARGNCREIPPCASARPALPDHHPLPGAGGVTERLLCLAR